MMVIYVEAIDLCQALRPRNTDITKALHLRWFHFHLAVDQVHMQ